MPFDKLRASDISPPSPGGRELEGGGYKTITSTLTLPLKGEGIRFFITLRMTKRDGVFRVRMTQSVV